MEEIELHAKQSFITDFETYFKTRQKLDEKIVMLFTFFQDKLSVHEPHVPNVSGDIEQELADILHEDLRIALDALAIRNASIRKISPKSSEPICIVRENGKRKRKMTFSDDGYDTEPMHDVAQPNNQICEKKSDTPPEPYIGPTHSPFRRENFLAMSPNSCRNPHQINGMTNVLMSPRRMSMGF